MCVCGWVREREREEREREKRERPALLAGVGLLPRVHPHVHLRNGRATEG